MSVLGSGCQRAALPKDASPRSAVDGDFLRRHHGRTLGRLHHAPSVPCREQVGGTAARRSGSWTAEASGAPKRGLAPAWFGCRQEDQRRETTRPGRCAGLAEASHRTQCRRSGPRWRCHVDGVDVRHVSLPPGLMMTGATKARGVRPDRARFAGGSISRPPSDRTSTASSCCRSARSSSAPSLGSTGRRPAGDWKRLNQGAPAFLRRASIPLMARELPRNTT